MLLLLRKGAVRFPLIKNIRGDEIMIVIALVIYSAYIQIHFRVTHYINLTAKNTRKKEEGVPSQTGASLDVEGASEGSG